MKIESLIQKGWKLQPPSATIIQLLNLISDSKADFREAVAVIESDSVLSAKLLARCNTTRYALTEPLGSVKECVMQAGFEEIHRLILELDLGPMLGGELSAYNMAAGTLWQHALITAKLTPNVLRHTPNPDTDAALAYTTGLLHDIGKLAINQLLNPGLKQQIYELTMKEGKTLLDAEFATLGTDHAEIGAELLHTWRIPGRIVEAVRHHHAPSRVPDSKLTAAVHVANTVAHQIGASPGWYSFAFTFDPAALTTLQLSVNLLEKLASEPGDWETATDLPTNPAQCKPGSAFNSLRNF